MESRRRADTLRDLRETYLIARQGGEQGWIERRLAARPETPREVALLELLGVEIQCRIDAGERPTPEEYLLRFPDDVEVGRAAFLPLGRAGSLAPDGPPTPGAPTVREGTPFPPDCDPSASSLHREPSQPAIDAHPPAATPQPIGPSAFGRYQVIGVLGRG